MQTDTGRSEQGHCMMLCFSGRSRVPISACQLCAQDRHLQLLVWDFLPPGDVWALIPLCARQFVRATSACSQRRHHQAPPLVLTRHVSITSRLPGHFVDLLVALLSYICKRTFSNRPKMCRCDWGLLPPIEGAVWCIGCSCRILIVINYRYTWNICRHSHNALL